ncbi:MAG: hypothetical protein ACP5J6_01555 [Candidatus Saccharicenans sp.]
MFGRNRDAFGHGREFGHRFGRDCHWAGPEVQVPEGYKYVGPSRCGWGPHAFYQEPSGRIVHAWDVYRRSWEGFKPTPEAIKAEVEALKAEKEALEKRIADLEKQIQKETEKTQL